MKAYIHVDKKTHQAHDSNSQSNSVLTEEKKQLRRSQQPNLRLIGGMHAC